METGYPQFGAYLNKWDVWTIVIIMLLFFFIFIFISVWCFTSTSNTVAIIIFTSIIDWNKYKRTGRPMVYSCSWPAYQIGLFLDALIISFETLKDRYDRLWWWGCWRLQSSIDWCNSTMISSEAIINWVLGKHPNYPAIAEHCNLWRNFDDISDSWEVITENIQWAMVSKNQPNLTN